MPGIEKIIKQMQNAPNDVRVDDAMKVCRAAFGEQRLTSGSYVVFRTPWVGDPRINLQNKAGCVKPYQVRQILAALEKLQTL